MKILISADIEGTAFASSWDDCIIGKSGYSLCQKQMTNEVVAAVNGALKAGAIEIVVRDAHDSAANIIAAELPKGTKLIRGWSGDPKCMLEGLDSSFDACVFIGYHTGSGMDGNPLSHTMSTDIYQIFINSQPATEFMIHCFTAAEIGVPSIFISGDKEICEVSEALQKGLTFAAIKEGVGNAVICCHPASACEMIESGVKKAIENIGNFEIIKIPEHYEIEISYKKHSMAYKASFFDGVEKINPTTIKFSANSWKEANRQLITILS